MSIPVQMKHYSFSNVHHELLINSCEDILYMKTNYVKINLQETSQKPLFQIKEKATQKLSNMCYKKRSTH